ncbi:hypothetical protein DFH06DRAFT_1347035 [Mycena polygramma]|nr:hypothetical protein DFH06DRAFT_1347035 [Mycena polygramma]
MTIPALKVASIYLSHFRPSVVPAGDTRIVQRLDSLWSSHIRGLAQAIHEILHGRDAALLPPELLGIVRISVQVLISNMVLLGATRVNADETLDPISNYHIPPFATMCFFMVEKFVNLVGFIGDDDVHSRHELFATMDIFLHAMVTRSDYTSAPVDAPGYESASADPFDYGFVAAVALHITLVVHFLDTSRNWEFQDTDFPYAPLSSVWSVLVPIDLAQAPGRPWRAISRSVIDLYSHTLVLWCIKTRRLSRDVVERFMATYTIDDAVPDLSRLSLSKRQLLSDFIMPEQGVPAFFRETLRPFVHLLLRAATRNFTHVHFLPQYSKSEHYLLCSWIEILLWHLRLVVQSVSHRATSLARGELTWATTNFHIPGEAFHMLRISAYLCQFVGYTTGRDFIVSLRPDILIPLLEAAGSDIHWSGAKGEYPEHDPYETLRYADLLLQPDSSRSLLSVGGCGGSPLSSLIEPLFPPFNYSGALPPPVVPMSDEELDGIVSSLARFH